MSAEPVILIKEIGDKVIITLNRPKSLNAISSNLGLSLKNALKNFEKEKSLVIMKGAGRAFCAGADVLQLNHDISGVFEIVTIAHALPFILHNYRTPLILLVNGIAFGAGAGLAALSKCAVVTEKAVFSMPEVKFAYHPNCGASYFFNRSKGKLGYYLALTGESLKGADIVTAGYATHYCHSSNLEKLEYQLVSCSNKDDVSQILTDNCEKILPRFSLAPVMDNINKCFSEPTVEDIIKKLKEDGSSWAKQTVEKLDKYSPSSLIVILRQLQRGKHMDLIECFLMDCNLSGSFHQFEDVGKGIRALLVDRSYVPKWEPAKLSDVTEEIIEEHFASSVDESLKKMLSEHYQRSPQFGHKL